MENMRSSEAHSVLKDKEIPFPEESIHLAQIQEKLTAALQAAEDSVYHLDAEYRDTKRYMVQHRGEIDPHEMFQNELALKRIDQSGAFAVKNRNRIAKLKDSPYFARIDFREEGEAGAEQYYIGSSAFSDKHELLVIDWRAPIASMFYDCAIGSAYYVAPQGRIEGRLTLKRQFKITKGVMEYAIETSENVQDDVLQRELAQNSDDKMKSIIATIQKEQNAIIRNDTAKTLIIQGVAGSGKTSIALHRIAFLLYRHKEHLSANNVAIISPNRVFGDYISNVLPELGEESIFEIGLREIAEVQLERVIGFEHERDPFETEDPEWSERARYKSTLEFKRQMDGYLAELPAVAFDAQDYEFDAYRVTAEWLRERINAYAAHPFFRRLAMIADDIHDRFMTENYMGDELPKPKTILKSLKAMLKRKDTLSLYKEFYQRIGEPSRFVLAGKRTLEWNDVFPFLYLHAAFAGLQAGGQIRHLVIDEMQDYTPIQFAVLNNLFACEKTILGDFGQSIDPNHRHGLGDLLQLYRGAECVMLKKSYRSTSEIINFAKRICPNVDIEVIERHGPDPVILTCESKEEKIAAISRLIKAFRESGQHTLGIIVKTNRDARIYYDLLTDHSSINLITPESRFFHGDVHITSVQMAKGLEFDEVVIADADDSVSQNENDQRLLYVACTRAMHRLTLLFSAERGTRIKEKA